MTSSSEIWDGSGSNIQKHVGYLNATERTSCKSNLNYGLIPLNTSSSILPIIF